MPTSAIDSVLFRDIFGSADMRRVWSDEFRTQEYLDWGAALARAEAAVGIIPQEAAAEITRVCEVENIDSDRYAEDTLNIGYPVLGLVPLTQPVVVTSVLAILLVLFGVKMPGDVVSAMKLLGGTVSGVSLFASGVILQAQSITLSWPALVSALGRVLVVPGLAFLALTGLHAEAELRRMVVLALASALMQVILATRYRVHEKENAALLLYSNLLCVPGLAFFIRITS